MSFVTGGLFKLLFAAIVLYIFKSKRIQAISLKRMMPIFLNNNYRIGLISYFVFTFFVGLALFDFKGPKVKSERRTGKEKLTFIVDYSSSMRVEDVGTSRYKLAINFMKDFIREIGGFDIRVVIYADKAYKVVPFTTDQNYVQTKISAIKEGLYPDGGSDLHIGLKESFIDDSFGSTAIILSDFENLEVDKINSVIEEHGLRVFSVAVGTKNGGFIPMGSNKLLSGYLTKRGKKVVSKLNEELLSRLNHQKKFLLTKNKYPLVELKSNLEKSLASVESSQSTDYLRKRYMPYFLIIGCLFLLISIYFKNFRKPIGFLMMLLCLGSPPSKAEEPLPKTNFELNRFANEIFFSEEKQDKEIPEVIYDELLKKKLGEENLNNLSSNYVTSLLRNNKRKKAISEILSKRLLENKKISDDLRVNIVNLLKQSAQSGSGSGGEDQEESQSKKPGNSQNNSNQKNNRNHNKKLTDKDRRLLEKLIGDDQVSQAEYMKRKIKKSSIKGSVRW